MNIYLIGYRGTGKTVLGRILSVRLGMDFLDSDELIVEQEGMVIPEIFAGFGEKKFRDLESEILLGISGMDNQVISTGGGIILRDENRSVLKKNGFCIYLFASPEIIYERIKDDPNRPALTKSPPMEEIRKLLEIRTPIYEELGDIAIDTGKMNIQECLDKILGGINGRMKGC